MRHCRSGGRQTRRQMEAAKRLTLSAGYRFSSKIYRLECSLHYTAVSHAARAIQKDFCNYSTPSVRGLSLAACLSMF